MPPKHVRSGARSQESNSARASQVLANLAARGICLPADIPSVSRTGTDRKQAAKGVTGSRPPPEKASAVVVPAYVSLEELDAATGASLLPQVMLPPMAIPMPRRLPPVPPPNANGAAATPSQVSAAAGSNGQAEPIKSANQAQQVSTSQVPAQVATSGGSSGADSTAVAAAKAAMRAMTLVAVKDQTAAPSKPASARPQQPGSAPAQPRAAVPRAPPPGFGAAATLAQKVTAASTAQQGPPAPAPTPSSVQPLPGIAIPSTVRTTGHDGPISMSLPAGPHGLKPGEQSVPAPASAPSAPAPASSGLADVDSLPTEAKDKMSQSPLPPRTPPPSSPMVQVASAPASSGPSVSASPFSPPPSQPAQRMSAAGGSQQPHIRSAAGASQEQAGVAAGLGGATSATPFGLASPGVYGMHVTGSAAYQQSQEYYGHPLGPASWHMASYTPYSPYFFAYGDAAANYQQYGAWQVSPQQYHYEQPQAQVRQAAVVPQQPQQLPLRSPQPTLATQKLQRPSRPPVQPQSLAPVAALFGGWKRRAVLELLRRELTECFRQNPELFRIVFGFELDWWLKARKKPLGEDDLLVVLPFHQYAAVLLRIDHGAAPELAEERRSRAALNPTLSMLLGLKAFGNALVLKLRMEYGLLDSANPKPAVAAGEDGGTDYLCCLPLDAPALRTFLLDSETLSWHVKGYREFLADVGEGLGSDDQVAWVARLPRTPLDKAGDPDLAVMAQLAAEATGLTRQFLDRAVAKLRKAAADGREGASEGAGSGAGRGAAAGSSDPGAAIRKDACLTPLLPLFRCLRCTSPWCPLAAGKRHGSSNCPFGHIWREWETEKGQSRRNPIFNASRPGALMPSASAAGQAAAGSKPLLQDRLQTKPCPALVLKLKGDSGWYTSKHLWRMVRAVLNGDQGDQRSAAAAKVRSVAASAAANGKQESSDSDSNNDSEAPGARQATSASNGGPAAGSSAAATEDGRGQELDDEEDGFEANIRQASEKLRIEGWQYYLSFCKRYDCRQCHSCHELELAAVVEGLLGDAELPTRTGRARWSGGPTVATGAAAAAGAGSTPRIGFELLAELEGDPEQVLADMKREVQEQQAGIGTSIGSSKANVKASATRPNRAGVGPASPASTPAAAATASRKPRTTGKPFAEQADTTGDAVGSTLDPATAPRTAGTATDEQPISILNWADEVEQEDDLAASDKAAAAAAVAAASRGLAMPQGHRSSAPPPQSSARTPSAVASAASTGRRDSRPLPMLPDHLDDEAPAADPGTAGTDSDGVAPAHPELPPPDRATVAASMASKSRNGVYVPPHLRQADGSPADIPGEDVGMEDGPTDGPLATLQPAPEPESASTENSVLQAEAVVASSFSETASQPTTARTPLSPPALTMPEPVPVFSPQPSPREPPARASFPPPQHALRPKDVSAPENAMAVPVPVPLPDTGLQKPLLQVPLPMPQGRPVHQQHHHHNQHHHRQHLRPALHSPAAYPGRDSGSTAGAAAFSLAGGPRLHASPASEVGAIPGIREVHGDDSGGEELREFLSLLLPAREQGVVAGVLPGLAPQPVPGMQGVPTVPPGLSEQPAPYVAPMAALQPAWQHQYPAALPGQQSSGPNMLYTAPVLPTPMAPQYVHHQQQ